MAKEQWHSYFRMSIIVLGIVFAGGGYAMKISDNSSKAEKNTVKIESVEDDVHDIQINQAEKIATDKAIASTLRELKVGLDSIKTDQSDIKTDIAIMKTKVDTLTKD